MAMFQSFRESGSDEANDEVVDICSYCATSEKLQPATHYCFDCGPCGRYICGICLRNHKLFLSGHRAIYIRSQTDIDSYRCQKNMHDQKEILELKKKNDQLETLLKQQTEELEKQRKYVRKFENDVKDLQTKIHETDENGKKQIKENEKALDEAKATIFDYEVVLEQMYAEKDILERRLQATKIQPRNTLMVAAIEIGIGGTVYAFSSQHDYADDPSKIFVCDNWVPGWMSFASLKAPTVVLFDENKKFHSFGFKAENTYSDLVLDDEHHKWYFFKRFTMRLYKKKITRSVEIEDVHGKKMKAIDVFGAVINYLKDHMLNLFKRRGMEVQNSDIHWVLTVPTIWDASAKQFMKEAAYKADIDGRLLSIVPEPEAASLCCQMLPRDKIIGSEDAKSALSYPGTKYMIIDLGDGTADFTVFEHQAHGVLKVLHKDSNDALGGTMVDEEFYGLLIKIIGGPVFQKFVDEYQEDYLELQKQLAIQKRNITPDRTGKIAIIVPVSVVQTYKDEMKEDIKEAIDGSPYCGKISWVRDKMRIEAQIIKTLFKPCSDKIVDHIKDLLKQPNIQGTNTFLMVGGFSDSPMLQDAVMKALPMGKVIIPEEAWSAVIKGAVIYGHRH